MDLEIRRIRPDEGSRLAAVRLAALRDTPSAFASTFEAEERLTAEQWAERARRGSAGRDTATFLALAGDRVTGLAAGYRPEPAGSEVELVSMWTAPASRRAGVARRLVAAVVDWAGATGAASVGLWVTRGNDAAAALYRAAGFVETGDHQPLPSDPCRDEIRMRRLLP